MQPTTNYLGTVTIGDFVGPEFLAELGRDFIPNSGTEFLDWEQAEHIMGASMSQSDIWDRLWRFGIIVDDDLNYYVPDDFDTEIPTVSIDSPPKECVS